MELRCLVVQPSRLANTNNSFEPSSLSYFSIWTRAKQPDTTATGQAQLEQQFLTSGSDATIAPEFASDPNSLPRRPLQSVAPLVHWIAHRIRAWSGLTLESSLFPPEEVDSKCCQV